ncbi:MAG: CpaF family protein [Actinobacteria bacterium]|nr:CpaF family protein [Actinomycetota bacterium]
MVPESKVLDGLSQLESQIHMAVIDELGPELYEQDSSHDKLAIKVKETIKGILSKVDIPLSASEKDQLVTDVMNTVVGYGPIEKYLNDPEVTEVMVNNPETVYVERYGKIYETGSKFIDEDHLRRLIDKIVGRVGRRIDESVPMVDARLPDGSRVNAIVHPLAINGPMLTIRKFAKDPFKATDLIKLGTFTEKIAEFLEACVKGRLNIIVSGGTGTGKTTTLNVLSSFIPVDERIITIEDAAELQLKQKHVLRLESRPANIEGKGAVIIRDLVRNALRMRPDRIVVGEARGAEALDMLQAMNTGHDGSLSTVHANSPRDVISRLETMVLMSGMDLPVRAIREQVSSAMDLIIHQARLGDGTRRITHVAEVQGMEGDIITLQDIFRFDFSMGVDEEGKFTGRVKSTGIRPKFSKRLDDLGIKLPAEIFEFEPFKRY